ncbi:MULTISPECIES: hypothetical protein [unclassified Serratia (in: enterobacteria)]|uniref:hypothetical protein n=1 Tax=Serratia TaxID=613 RepID=UPI000C243ADB|nr:MULTISPECIES: hypothetical protein [unclassified Serratia (in: enterobacteria)]MBM0402063.1 hypothetical protein [Serratia sp. 4542]PJI65702.1 hypothetical protein CUN64_24295 [Serratia sp. TKO39]
MKAGVYSSAYRHRYAIVAAVAVLVCCVSTYFLFFKPQIPQCTAVERFVNQYEGKMLERTLLVSVVPDGVRHATILFNGSVLYDGKRYIIERSLGIDYRKWGGNYEFRVRENIKKPPDTLQDEALNRSLPMEGQTIHLRIEKMDARHYLFVDNHAPYYVCVTSS